MRQVPAAGRIAAGGQGDARRALCCGRWTLRSLLRR